jgi:hypothetical protein
MQTNAIMNAIAELDLEPVKTKLMHVASGEGWSRSKVDALDIEYRRFLYLMHAYPHEETAPTVDVDTFWHYHILDTMKYARDCEATFGYFMHHYPHLGMEGEHDAGAEQRGAERLRALYEQTFGEAYIRVEAYGVEEPALAASAAAFCMCRPGQQQAPVRPADAGAQAAFCMCRPGEAEAPVRPVTGAAAAFCMRQEGPRTAAGNDAAFCMRQEGPRAAAGNEAAFCMRQEAPRAAAGNEAAFCMRQEAPRAAAGNDAAFCMRQTAPVRPATGAQAAFCMRQDERRAAANDAAFCMCRGSASQAGALAQAA